APPGLKLIPINKLGQTIGEVITFTGDKAFSGSSGSAQGDATGKNIAGNIIAENIRTEGDASSDVAALKVSKEAEARNAAAAGEEAADRIAVMDSGIGVTSKIIAALDAGAVSGDMAQFSPTVKQASKELKHLQALAGLNVLQTTTFGSLSQEELKFALATAIPLNMDTEELKAYMKIKLAGQQKLRALHLELNELYAAGNSKSKALIIMEKRRKDKDKTEKANDFTQTSDEDLLSGF
ncbi:MAG: hypothetical protein ACXQTI_05300, partial [Candidatus Nezhaarchaeales archaeon]